MIWYNNSFWSSNLFDCQHVPKGNSIRIFCTLRLYIHSIPDYSKWTLQSGNGVCLKQGAGFLKVKTSVFSLANKIAEFLSLTCWEHEMEKLEWSWAGVEWSLYSNSSALLGNMDPWCLDFFLYYFQWGIRNIWNSWAVFSPWKIHQSILIV